MRNAYLIVPTAIFTLLFSTLTSAADVDAPSNTAIKSLKRSSNNAHSKNPNNSLSDLSEEDQLRLQMQMDRRSKAEETLSNTMKKQSDTENGIIKNMK